MASLSARTILITLTLLAPYYLHSSSLASTLWGEDPGNYMQGGQTIFHFGHNSWPLMMVKPSVGVTYNSISALYFRTCLNGDAYGLGVKRKLFEMPYRSAHLSAGYGFGLLYGYCMKDGDIDMANTPLCRGVTPIIPALQILLNYRYNNIGLEVAQNWAATTLSFTYYFDLH